MSATNSLIQSPWVKVLFAPILVGISMFFASHFFSIALEDKKELTYQITTLQLDLEPYRPGQKRVKLESNDLGKLYLSEIEIENTGQAEINDIRVFVEFGQTDSRFQVISSFGVSKPDIEDHFIKVEWKKPVEVREYSVIRSGEADYINYVTHLPPEISISARQRNLSIIEQDTQAEMDLDITGIAQVVGVLSWFILVVMLAFRALPRFGAKI